jgi:hypothetical protein
MELSARPCFYLCLLSHMRAGGYGNKAISNVIHVYRAGVHILGIELKLIASSTFTVQAKDSRAFFRDQSEMKLLACTCKKANNKSVGI